MKMYVVICAAAMLLSGAAYAQSSQNTENKSGNQGWEQNSQHQSQTGQKSDQTGNQATSGNSDLILDGCVTRRETDFYITPANGQAVRLGGNQDLSGAENHSARMHGHYQSPGQSASNGTGSNRSSQSGVASTDQNGTGGNNQGSNSMSSSSQNSQTGNQNGQTQMGNTAGQPSAMANSSANSQSNGQNGREFVVTRVDSVSTACPNDTSNR